MLRRILAFALFIALIGAVSFLVYFNVQETSFRFTPKHELTLPLGVLMLGATIAGALVMFVLALMREGRHALREWRVHRELQAAERTAEYQTEARSLALAGDFKRARLLLAKATNKRAPDVSDVVDYAETFLLEGDAGQARRVLEEGQKNVGNEPLLLYSLGRACRAAGDTAAAISTLERALRVYSSSVPILTMLRDLLFETGAWQRAAEVQERIIAVRPGDERERNLLAGARFEAARSAASEVRLGALRGVTGAHPDFVPAVLARAKELEQAGDHRRAVKVLERAAKRRPRAALLDELERITPEDRRSHLAKLYSKLVATQPGNVKLRLRAAHFLAANGRAAEAEQLLRGVSANGDAGLAHAVWAEIHEARSERERAQEEYRQALNEAPAAVLSCEICGAASAGWQDRCAQCGAWGTLESL
jgi:tetratricopeptide (TPR) repeat protein